MLLLLLTSTTKAAAQRTTRYGLRIETQKKEQKHKNIDTVAIDSQSDKIIISGYDKPLKSKKETFFISNNSAVNITGLRICFEYLDIKGRSLHKCEHHIIQTIPSGETRQAAIRSWDVQQSFYYKLSTKPRKQDGTPYDIRYRIISIDIESNPEIID